MTKRIKTLESPLQRFAPADPLFVFSWTNFGAELVSVFTDDIFKLLDDLDNSKTLQFQLEGLDPDTDVVWDVQDKSGTVMLHGDSHTLLTDIGTNTHAQVDTHIADATVHFVESSIDHAAIANIGTNTHAQLDIHVADSTVHFTQAAIDHTAIANIGTNTHAQLDIHVADSTVHFTEASIDHTALLNVGSNTHAQIDTHIADATLHFTEASIDHTAIANIGTNTHAQIDTHIADATLHFTEASIDHTAIANIGTNTHAQIDTHIADATLHFTEASIDHTAIANIGDATHAQIDSLLNFFNGSFVEKVTGDITSSDGITVTFELENADTVSDLTMRFSDGFTALDVTPAATLNLTAGTLASPSESYIYIPLSTKVLTESTSDWPSEEHIRVAYAYVPSAAEVNADGPLAFQFWNDGTDGTSGNENGHMLHLGEHIRASGAVYHSGVGPNGTTDWITITGGSPDTIHVKSTAGVVYQLHAHAVPAQDTSAGSHIHVVNHSSTPNVDITDLATQLTDASGVSMSNKYYTLVLWGAANKGGSYSPLFCNLPTGSYFIQAEAESDQDNYTVYDIPSAFLRESSTGFLMFEVLLKHSPAGGGTWTHIRSLDLRGRTPGAAAGGGAGGAVTEFADNQFVVFDESTLFEMTHQLSSLSANREITALDAAGVNALSDAVLTVESIPFIDASGRLDEDTTFVRDAGTGNIGIGTTAPGATAHIVGSADQVQLSVDANSTQTANIVEIRDDVGGRLVTVSGDGNFGVGTANPDQLIHVVSSTGQAWLSVQSNFAATAGMTFNASGQSQDVFSLDTANNLVFRNTNGSHTGSIFFDFKEAVYFRDGAAGFAYRLAVATNGEIGVGTISPAARLHVDGSVDEVQFMVDANATQTTNIVEIRNSAGADLVIVDGAGQLEVTNQILIAGGTPGAGKVLTDVGGTGLATWETPAAGGGGGWTDDGTVVRLDTATDQVSAGTASPTAGVTLTAYKDANSFTATYMHNPNAGAAAYAEFVAKSDNQNLHLRSFSNAFSGTRYGSITMSGKSEILQVPSSGGSGLMVGCWGADDLFFGTNNVMTMVHKGSTQHVGIGPTATADVALHVKTDGNETTSAYVENATSGTVARALVQAVCSSTGAFLIANSPTTTGTRLGVNKAGFGEVLTTGTAGLMVGTIGAVPLHMGTDDTLAMTIDSSQQVGIGTATPTARFHVVGSADEVQLSVDANSTQTANIVEIRDDLGNDLVVVEGGTGWLGVGVNPSGVIHAKNPTGGATIRVESDGASTAGMTFKASATWQDVFSLDTANNLVFRNTAGTHSGSIFFDFEEAVYFRDGGATYRLAISNSGNIGIGDGFLSPTAKLHVEGYADQVQLSVDANATQTTNIVEIRDDVGADLVVVDGSGKAGIGADPNTQLHVEKDQGAATAIQVNNGSADASASAQFMAIADSSSSTWTQYSNAAGGASFGVTQGGQTEIISLTGNGMLFGTQGSDDVVIGTNDTMAVTIDTLQRVGIGTTTPFDLLHVAADGAVDVGIVRHSTDTGGCGLNFRKARGTEASPLVVVAGDVLGNIKFNGYDSLGNWDVNASIRCLVGTVGSGVQGGELQFRTTTTAGALTSALYIDEAQQVGIGTDSPDVHLHVYDGSGTSTVRIESGTTSNATVILDNTTREWKLQNFGGDFRIKDETGGGVPLLIEAGAPTNALYIDISGNVGVGADPTSILEASGTGSQRVGVRNVTESAGQETNFDFLTGSGAVANSNATAIIKAVITQATPSTLKSELKFYVNTGDSASQVMVLGDTGDIGVGGAENSSYIAYFTGDVGVTGTMTDGLSDVRVKTNVTELDGTACLQSLMQMRPVNFEFLEQPFADAGVPPPKPAGEQNLGFIAQDIEPLFPSVVIERPVGSSVGPLYKNLIHKELLAPVVAATQEIARRAQDLKAKLDAAQARVQTLETQMAQAIVRILALENT